MRSELKREYYNELLFCFFNFLAFSGLSLGILGAVQWGPCLSTWPESFADPGSHWWNGPAGPILFGGTEQGLGAKVWLSRLV